MPDHYYTIKQPSEGFYREKGSKFISRAFNVNSEEEIKEILEELKKEFHDARHHCYAWVLGPEGERERANDDGEPSNSAGKPILAQINSFGLTNVLIVVIRYFGGTLLGMGGLINAYRSAGRDALKKAKKIKRFLYTCYEIHFPYAEMNIIMKVLKELNAEQYDQKFELSCSMKAKIKKREKNTFLSLLKPYENIKIIYLRED